MVEQKKDTPENSKHQVFLEGRTNLRVTGVDEVKSFDAHEVRLATTAGDLRIVGHDLGVKNLDLGHTEIEIEGLVDALNYPAGKDAGKKSLLEKLFK